MGARTWRPCGRSGGAERLDAGRLSQIRSGGPEVERQPEAASAAMGRWPWTISLIQFGANPDRHGEPVLRHPEAA
jgi:hypothetical protein